MQTDDTSLTPAQHRAIPALMANNTIVAAAAQAGVNERTIRRWLSGDVDFNREYNRVRRENFQQLLARRDCGNPKFPSAIAQASAFRRAPAFAYQGTKSKDLALRLQRLEGQPQRPQDSTPNPIAQT